MYFYRSYAGCPLRSSRTLSNRGEIFREGYRINKKTVHIIDVQVVLSGSPSRTFHFAYEEFSRSCARVRATHV